MSCAASTTTTSTTTPTVTTATASRRARPGSPSTPSRSAGDPGFELCPALCNRFEPGEIRRRFDAMTDVMGLERARARAWTLGRVLQNTLWEIEVGRPLEPVRLEVARRLREVS